MALFGIGDEKINVIAEARAKVGSESAVRVMLESLVAPSRAESGCKGYALFEDKQVAGSFYTFEEWSSEEALAKHLAGEKTTSILAAAMPMLVGEPKVRVLKRTGLPDW